VHNVASFGYCRAGQSRAKQQQTMKIIKNAAFLAVAIFMIFFKFCEYLNAIGHNNIDDNGFDRILPMSAPLHEAPFFP
jgi:hypothetical protein